MATGMEAVYENLEDFVGFEFNGHHSTEFNLKRVSDGSRYQDSLIPTFSDYTADIPGGEGTFYWGTDFKSKPISLNVAFDNITEKNLREIRNWLAVKEPAKLRFDESPYKYYTCKIDGEPQFNYICFTENGQRVYKGEGTINFIAYYPYARSYSRDINDFSKCNNKSEWEISSGIKDKPDGSIEMIDNDSSDGFTSGRIKVANYGDFSTDWNIKLRKLDNHGAKIKFELFDNFNNSIGPYFVITFKPGETGSLENQIYTTHGRFEINTKNRSIVFIDNDTFTRTPALFLLTEGDFFQLPVKDSEYYIEITSTKLDNVDNYLSVSEIRAWRDGQNVPFEIQYDYLYY